MSTNLECSFIETEPNKWYYILEQGSAPKDAWDWMEYADAYGSFDSFDKAHKHLRDNHANPGGYSKGEYVEGYKPSEIVQRLIEESEKRKSARKTNLPWFRNMERF